MNDDTAVALAQLRASIDICDAELVRVLASRFELTRKVGEFKARHGLPPKDPAREAEHLAQLRTLAVQERLDPEFVMDIFRAVMAQVVLEHQQVNP
jgi:chorismate mutase